MSTPMRSLLILFSVLACAASSLHAQDHQVYMANGIKIGEVDQDSAVIWTRLTAKPERTDGKKFNDDIGKEGRIPDLDEYNNSVPGIGGQVRVTYWLAEEPEGRTATEWQAVRDEKDYTRHFVLENLDAGKQYRLLVEGRADENDNKPVRLKGRFRTAPAVDTPAKVTFTVVTCGDFPRRDDKNNGHQIYRTMLRLDPDFFVHTGDIEYYDKPKPHARHIDTARFKMNRIYAMPFQRNFHNEIASYFMKDDHDTLKNDCWPGQTAGDLTFEQGLDVFREQFPFAEDQKTYRTIRWGKDLQIWLVEGRDYRSPNTMEDGPDKTIWGEEQKKWFFESVENSDATFRILISPTPIVGPDREKKSDNHANTAFATEGQEIRDFLSEQKNMFVFCGDRHWQYKSIDPQTGVKEYGCGPSADQHSNGWRRELQTEYQVFLRLAGGFLHVEVTRKNGKPQITIRHCSVDGKAVNTDVFTAE